MKTAACLLALFLLPASAWAGKKTTAPPPLAVEHRHPSGAFTFRTPEGWSVEPGSTGALEAWGGDLGVRFYFREGEAGYDSLHATCISDGLGPMAETDPRVSYEYEYLSGLVADRRVLDSAHNIRYDEKVHGHRDWRQRTVTIVGGGLSLCVMSYAPRAMWKKDHDTRILLDSVLASLTFHR